jgi:hypothetical protein
VEVKASEAQGLDREAGSEGSVEHRCEPTYRNRIRGAAGRASEQAIAKPISTKAAPA